MAQLPQVLEVPRAYGGGAGIPSSAPSRSEQWVLQVTKGLSTQLLGAPRVAARGLYNRLSGDCCPCPGQQGRRMPFDQTPYSEPGLGQPMRPQKPFQGLDKDPCMEALQRAGIDPDCLRQAMRPKSKRVSRGTTRRGGTVRIVGRPPMSREEEEFYFGDAPARRRRRKKKAAKKKAAVRSARVQRKASPKRKSRAPRVQKGKYQLLQNGACYDPKARKFVKRSLCK